MPIREQDQLLINLILSDSPTQGDLDSFLSNWDLDVEGADKGLLLAVFKQKHTGLVFPSHVGPRLDGLIRYFRFYDARILAELKKFNQYMAAHNIPYIVMSGMALRVMNQDIPRNIRSVEIGVKARHVRKVRKFVPGFITVREADELLLNQPLEISVSGIYFRVPSRERLICRLLLDLEYGFNVLESFYALPLIICQLHELFHMYNHDDWTNVRNYLISSAFGSKVHTAIGIYSSITHDNVSDFSMGTFSDQELIDYQNRCRYYNDVFKPLRKMRHQYTLSRLITDPGCLFQWVKVRVKFKMMKRAEY